MILGSLLANMLIGGIEKSFGIMFIVIQEDFNASAVETSWIGSLASTLRFLCGEHSVDIVLNLTWRYICKYLLIRRCYQWNACREIWLPSVDLGRVSPLCLWYAGINLRQAYLDPVPELWRVHR